LSGTSLSSGDIEQFESGATDLTSVVTLSDSKAIVIYQDEGNSSYGTACIIDRS